MADLAQRNGTSQTSHLASYGGYARARMLTHQADRPATYEPDNCSRTVAEECGTACATTTKTPSSAYLGLHPPLYVTLVEPIISAFGATLSKKSYLDMAPIQRRPRRLAAFQSWSQLTVRFDTTLRPPSHPKPNKQTKRVLPNGRACPPLLNTIWRREENSERTDQQASKQCQQW